MAKIKCFCLDIGPSNRNLPLFFTYMVYPVYILATILKYYDGLNLKYVLLNFFIVFSLEWLMRNLVLCQRPGYICLEEDRLFLWYFSGILRIEYLSNRYQVLENKNGEFLRLKIKNRILPLLILKKKYLQSNQRPETLDIIKIVKK